MKGGSKDGVDSLTLVATSGATAAERARRRMEVGRGDPLFIADWERALFIHFAVDGEALRSAVPYELDLWQGKTAIISLVAFTMRAMRPAFGGRALAACFAPMATHEFLNARTYVRGPGGEEGILFLREWLPNGVARLVGPLTYGLPYRMGKLEYRHEHEAGRVAGCVRPRKGGGCLRYEAELGAEDGEAGELRDCLLERYTAFTAGPVAGWRRKFRVWHEPWRAVTADVRLEESTLLDRVPGCRSARLIGAHYSRGVRGVWMGRLRSAASL